MLECMSDYYSDIKMTKTMNCKWLMLGYMMTSANTCDDDCPGLWWLLF